MKINIKTEAIRHLILKNLICINAFHNGTYALEKQYKARADLSQDLVDRA